MSLSFRYKNIKKLIFVNGYNLPNIVEIYEKFYLKILNYVEFLSYIFYT